jgi:hypothetical protein
VRERERERERRERGESLGLPSREVISYNNLVSNIYEHVSFMFIFYINCIFTYRKVGEREGGRILRFIFKRGNLLL